MINEFISVSEVIKYFFQLRLRVVKNCDIIFCGNSFAKKKF